MSVRHAVLALLTEGPKYGLKLRQEFEERTGEVWPLNVGQVYTTLQRLERDGLVESDDVGADGPQKTFRITPAGDGRARRLAAHSPGHDVTATRRAGHQGARRQAPRASTCTTLSGPPPLPGAADAAVHPAQGDESDDVGVALVVDAELFRLDGVIRWLDAADARLRRAPAAEQPSTPAAVEPRIRRRVEMPR